MENVNKSVLVSLYQNITSTKSTTVNLWDWLNSPSYKEDIKCLQYVKDKDEKRLIKSRLPCITPSGLFEKRNESALISHSGFICIDIDAADNPGVSDFNKLRDEVSKIINVSYCSLSASGHGVFCLIPIRYPEKHKQHFKALQADFKYYNIIIDKACGDVTRLRLYSYDPHAYLNKDAVIYSKVIEQDLRNQQKSLKRQVITVHLDRSTLSSVLKIVSLIEQKGVDITDSYQQWHQIGCALANEFGEDGRDIFHAVSQFNNGYHTGKTDRFFDGCIGNSYGYRIGTFFHWAENYGLLIQTHGK